MKKINKIFGILVLFSVIACEKPDEYPPRQEGYETKYIMPEASFLTEHERQIIEQQEREYQEAIK